MYRPDENNNRVQDAQEQVWDYLEYIVNIILFFLLGPKLSDLILYAVVAAGFSLRCSSLDGFA
ncbi:MAG: hypothetical protein SCABRO_03550 [Candidatus Scalindua brodae]|uniref:Uncharacterized protein n=1 Tax=Candidatus Scalindua brodae TaxID=237368 RepID=A0A0B0EJ35_9BACT|nr:MAG: hypothetical protein SCABRO_03550 [Candidatus Scalindua brodae]